MAEIAKMLVLSTAHVGETTARQLDGFRAWPVPVFAPVVYPKGEFGWILPITEDMLECHTTRAFLPSELLPIIDLAEVQGCTWLMFDRDAEILPGLPTFEW